MKCIILSILGIFCFVSITDASFYSSFFGWPRRGTSKEPIKVEKIEAIYPKQSERLVDNIVEIDEDFFQGMGSAFDLESLTHSLGIEDDPIYKPPEASRKNVNRRNWIQSDYTPEIVDETRSSKTMEMTNPQQAKCIPELKSVSLGLDDISSSVHYYPTCVRINQCGGCCLNKDLLTCKPTESNKITVKVFELTKQNLEVSNKPVRRIRQRRSKLKASFKYMNVIVEEHTKCDCLCTATENDCDLRIHVFDYNICACKCINVDEKDKCLRTNTHTWVSKTCACICREQQICSTGDELDNYSCMCKRRTRSVLKNENYWN